MNIGIIGKGFVGSAVEHGFSCNENFRAKIKVYDINPELSSHSLSETINTSDCIFLLKCQSALVFRKTLSHIYV